MSLWIPGLRRVLRGAELVAHCRAACRGIDAHQALVGVGFPIRTLTNTEAREIGGERLVESVRDARRVQRERYNANNPDAARGRAEAAKLYPITGKCKECQRRPATQRHHRNGDPTDNRPTNVRLLCDHCHVEIERWRRSRAGRLSGQKWRKL